MNIRMNPNFGIHNTSVRSGRITYLVIHYVGATGDAESNIRYYNNPSVTKASADFFVGFNGDIWQYNPDPSKRYCWAVGGDKLGSVDGGKLYGVARNFNCINIEMCVKLSSNNNSASSRDWYFEDATVKSAINLANYLMDKYSIPVENVIRHYDVTGKICPNPYVYNHTKHTWKAFKESLGIKTPVVEEKKSGWKEEDGGWRFYNGDTGKRIENDWHHDLEKDLWYWFDGNGMMITNKWYKYNGDWYFMDKNGVMCKSQLVVDSDKIFAVDKDGKMINEPITLTPGDDGALEYPGLAQ